MKDMVKSGCKNAKLFLTEPLIQLMDPELVKRVGIAAAYKGGIILRSCLGKLSGINKKGKERGRNNFPVPNIDLVTEADKKEILAINGKIHDEMLNLLELK